MSLNALLGVLSPKQARSVVEAQDTPQIALWSGAVSSGKTFGSLFALLIAILAAPDHGLIVIVGRTLQTIERNIIDPLQSSHLFGFLAAHVHHTAGSNTAIILGRTVHLIGASDVRAEARIRGATIALAYVDEATLVPQGFWMMLLSRLRVPGAKLLATTNPDGPAHWLRRDFLLRGAEVGVRSWHFTLDDNPSLEPSYVARLKAQYVGLWYRRFIAGEWCLASGAIYDMWDPARHVIPAAQIPPIVAWIGAGVDYGTTNPFHSALLGLGADRRLYITDEWRYDSKRERRQLTDVEYSRRFRTHLDQVPAGGGVRGVRPQYVVVDPSALSFRVQLHEDGVTSTLGDNEVLPGLRTTASLLAAGLLSVSDACPELIDEFPGYSWDERAAEQGEDKPIKVGDHGLDATRYVLHTTRPVWQYQLAEPVLLAA